MSSPTTLRPTRPPRRTIGTVSSQEEALRATELVVVVNVAAKLDTLHEAELHHALLGKDSRFELVGLQEQYYRALFKQMLKTNSGNFEREWLGLISRGKKKKRPLVTTHELELVRARGEK